MGSVCRAGLAAPGCDEVGDQDLELLSAAEQSSKCGFGADVQPFDSQMSMGRRHHSRVYDKENKLMFVTFFLSS